MPWGLFAEEEPEESSGWGIELEDPEEILRKRRERLLAMGALPAEEVEGASWRPSYLPAFARKVGNTVRSGAVGLASLAAKANPMHPGVSALDPAAERAAEKDRLAREHLAEASVNLPTPLATLGFWAAETTGMALDPLEALPGGMIAAGARRGAQALTRGRKVATAAAPVADDLLDLGRQSLEIGEEAGSPLSRARAIDQGLEEAGETGLRGSELPIGPEGRLRPPETPFQYNAQSLDLPETALPEIRKAMSSEKVLTRRRTGIGIDYDDPAKLRAEVGMAEEDFLKAPAGKVWNREEGALLDAYVGKWGRRVEELRPRMREQLAQGLEASPEIDAFADARGKWIDLLAVSMAGRTEAGRALESYKHLRTALDSPESLRTHLAKKLSKANKGPLSEDDLDLLTKIDLDDPGELGALLSKIQKPKWWEYPRELFYSSILSGLGTHGRNIIGNAFHAVSQIPVRVGAAIVDAPLATLTGRQRERYMSEILPSLHGLYEGFGDGLVRFKESFARGGSAVSKFDVPRSAFRRSPSKFVRERVAPVVDIPFRALAAADELFKGINRGAELRALATRSGLQRGLNGDELVEHVSRFMADPPAEALERAVQFERKMTFTNPLGPTASHLEKMKNSSPFLGYLIPFVRTPVNLFKRGIEFTPANLPRAVMMGVKGAPEAADELAKVAVGTGMMGYVGMKAAAGELTGPPPAAAGERDAFYQSGKQPFSIRFGDKWYSFAQIEPLAMPLALVASAHEGFKRGDGEATTFERMQKAMALLLANQLDRSYLSGLSDLVELKTFGEQALVGFAGRQVAALGVPFSGAMRSLANAIDPRIVEKRRLRDYAMENVPGLKGELPARLTRFGEEIRKTRWQAAGPSGTPLVPSKETDDEVENGLAELGLTVSFPGKTIEGERLAPEEYRAYLQAVGPKTKEALRFLLAEESLKEFPPETQQKIVDNFVRSTRDVVRAEAMLGLVPGIPPLMVKKQLGGQVDAFNSARSRVDGISAEYNERTRGAGGKAVSELVAAGESAEEGWTVAWGDLQEAAKVARRQGLTDEQIVGLLRTRGISHRVARALVAGQTMTYQHYRQRLGDF